MEDHPSKDRSSCEVWRRWRDVLLSGLVAAFLLWLSVAAFGGTSFAGLARDVMVRLATVLLPWQLWVSFAGVWALLAFWGPLRSSMQLAVWRSAFWRFPPLVVAFLTGIPLFVLLCGMSRGAGLRSIAAWLPSLWASTALCVGALSAVLARLLMSSFRRPGIARRQNGATKEASPADKNFLGELAWIMDDRPVDEDQSDRFHFKPCAERLATLLLDRDTQSIGVCGDYGSGKSTLFRLAMSRVRTCSSHIRFAEVGAWGLTEESILRRVLGAMVNEMEAAGLDILELRGLPAAYAEAVGDLHPTLGSIAGSCAKEPSPDEILKGIDRRLRAAGLRLVVHIEDLDRNGGDSDAGWPLLYGLMERLRNLPTVVVVLACGTGAAHRLHLSRLCQYIETPPRLSSSDVACTLSLFQERLVALASGDHHVTHHNPNTENPLPEPPSFHDLSMVKRQSFGEVVRELARTPRAMKCGFRRAYTVWKQLHGEVDLDELVVLSVVRENAPIIFDLACDDIPTLRSTREETPNTEEFYQKLLARWQEGCEKQGIGTALASELLQCFGLLYTPADSAPPDSLPIGPQSILRPWGGVYMDRILRGALMEGEFRDQRLYRDIEQWNDTCGDPIIDEILTSDDAQLRLSAVWGAASVPQQRIVEALLDRYMQRDRENASGKSREWRFISKLLNPIARGLPADWISQRRSIAMRYSLSLALALPDPNSEMRGALQKALDGGTTLENILSSNMEDNDALCRMVFSINEEARLRRQTPIDMAWLGNAITEATTRKPRRLIPYLYCMFVEGGDEKAITPRGGACLSLLFPKPSSIDLLLRVLEAYLANPVQYSDPDSRMSPHVNLAFGAERVIDCLRSAAQPATAPVEGV